jgi:hypothetical protein
MEILLSKSFHDIGIILSNKDFLNFLNMVFTLKRI